MREMIVHELTQATQELVREFARFLPRLMVMLIVVLVGWVIAYLVKAVLRSFLRLRLLQTKPRNFIRALAWRAGLCRDAPDARRTRPLLDRASP